MKNLKKLKVVLATELENRAVYQEAFDIVKDAEKLEKYVKELSDQVKLVQKDIENYKNRAERAKAETEKIEAEYTEQAQAMDEDLRQRVKDAELSAETIIGDARDEANALQKGAAELEKSIKKLVKQEEAARAKTLEAEEELEKIRGKLKSI